MKKKTAAVATSVAAIAVCSSIIAGSTFALFTSESQTNVIVKSANVKMSAYVDTENAVYSHGEYDEETASYVTVEGLYGGTAAFNDNTLTVVNFAPLDNIAFDLIINNESTVTVKYRTKLWCSENPEFLNHLNVTIDGTAYDGSEILTSWTEATVGAEIKPVHIAISFPDDENNNQFKNQTCAISYYIEAVQGNANVTDNVAPEETDLSMFNTTYEENKYVVQGLAEGSDVTEIYIPATHDGKEVTVAEGAFASTSLKKVTVDCPVISANAFGGVEYGHGTFEDYEEFQKISFFEELNIGPNVEEIGSGAFASTYFKGDEGNGCYFYEYGSKLTTVNFAKNGKLTKIGSGAFQNCGELTSIVIPEGVTEIGSSVFYNCSKLKSVVIPEGVTEISYGTFLNCGSLTEVVIPDSVEYIADQAFQNCFELTTINMPTAIVNKFKTLEYASIDEYKTKFVDGAQKILADLDEFAAAVKFDELVYYPDGMYEKKIAFFAQYTSLQDMYEKLGEKNFAIAIGYFYDNDSVETIVNDLNYSQTVEEVTQLFAGVADLNDNRYIGYIHRQFGKGAEEYLVNGKTNSDGGDSVVDRYKNYLSVSNALGDMEFVNGMFSTYSNVSNKVSTIKFNGNEADWDSRLTVELLFGTSHTEEVTVVCNNGESFKLG